MSRTVFFCIPVRVAAIIGAVSVLFISMFGAASGWYWIHVAHSIPEYASHPGRIKAFAGVLGTLGSIVVFVSSYGLFSLITGRRRSVRHYLWSSWLTFFVACIAVASFTLLLWWVHAWTVAMPVKVVASVIAAYGLSVQLYLTVVLRLYYEQLQEERERKDEDIFTIKKLPDYC